MTTAALIFTGLALVGLGAAGCGYVAGRDDGRAEGRWDGYRDGHARGRREGRREGLLAGRVQERARAAAERGRIAAEAVVGRPVDHETAQRN